MLRNRIRQPAAAFGVAVQVLALATALACVGGAPPEIARVPIPETTLALVVTKDPVKRLHYCQLFDHNEPISGHVMLTGSMIEDLTLEEVRSHGDEVSIYLSGGHYSRVVVVDSRRRLILSPSQGRSSTAVLEQ